MEHQLRYDESIVGSRFIYRPASTDYHADWATGVHNYGNFGTPREGDWFVTTGYYYAASNSSIVWLQTTAGVFISADFYDDRWKNTWTIEQNYERVRTYSQSQAQALVNKIIKCNKHIIANNLLCARYANKFTKEQQQQIRDLQTRLKARNQALINDGFIDPNSIKTGYPEGYAELAPYMDKLMNGEAIGIATWVVVVVACVVVASLSTAAYYAYKWYADQAEKDVQFSDELTRVLASKLTEEEYQQLLNETRGIVTKARIKQTLTTGGGTLLWAAIAVAGGYLAWQIAKRV